MFAGPNDCTPGWVDGPIITITINPNPVINYIVAPNDTVCNGTPITIDGTGANVNYAFSNGFVDGVATMPTQSASTNVNITATNALT